MGKKKCILIWFLYFVALCGGELLKTNRRNNLELDYISFRYFVLIIKKNGEREREIYSASLSAHAIRFWLYASSFLLPSSPLPNSVDSRISFLSAAAMKWNENHNNSNNKKKTRLLYNKKGLYALMQSCRDHIMYSTRLRGGDDDDDGNSRRVSVSNRLRLNEVTNFLNCSNLFILFILTSE